VPEEYVLEPSLECALCIVLEFRACSILQLLHKVRRRLGMLTLLIHPPAERHQSSRRQNQSSHVPVFKRARYRRRNSTPAVRPASEGRQRDEGAGRNPRGFALRHTRKTGRVAIYPIVLMPTTAEAGSGAVSEGGREDQGAAETERKGGISLPLGVLK
jgi:hypothetical protein